MIAQARANESRSGGLSLVDAVRPILIPSDETFGDDDFLPAHELLAMADELRARHAMPTEITIDVVWKRKGGTHQGKQRIGYCQKTSGLAKWLSRHDFVIWVAADATRELSFTAAQFEALIFHELHHAGCDPETLEPVVIAHDFEGFLADLEHYGLWQHDLVKAAESFRQARMFVP